MTQDEQKAQGQRQAHQAVIKQNPADDGVLGFVSQAWLEEASIERDQLPFLPVATKIFADQIDGDAGDPGAEFSGQIEGFEFLVGA